MMVNTQTIEKIELHERLARADEDIKAGRIYAGEEAKDRVRELARDRYGSTVDR